jgi:hypothetical protein
MAARTHRQTTNNGDRAGASAINGMAKSRTSDRTTGDDPYEHEAYRLWAIKQQSK